MVTKQKCAHAPGPWEVDCTSEKSGWKGLSVKVAGENRYLANLIFQCDDSEKANAHLIAAAPEMAEYLRLGLSLPEDPSITREVWQRNVERILAKIEGAK